MKKTILISLLCIASATGFAQVQYTIKEMPALDNNGQPLTVTPSFTAPCKMVANEPCSMYKKDGEIVLTCPDLWYEPQEICEQTQGEYTGNYPYKLDPEMPANAVPARPVSLSYKLIKNPPCYEYTNKHGHVIMECHGLMFPPSDQDIEKTK
jgi:hypothetical protein